MKNDDGSLRPLHFSRSFELPRARSVRKARLYVTAQGCYHASINGQSVGDQCMAPGWQSYKYRMHYQVYDFEALLETNGANLITVDVAPGWFASVLAWVDGRRCLFGDELGLLAQLHVSFKDGDAKTFVLGTDGQWQCQCSRITSSEIYNGEVYDMTFESAPVTRGEAQSTNSRTNSQAVKVVSFDFAKLVSPNAPPVRVTEAVRPVSIFESASGKTIIDFGQNLFGWLQIFELRKRAGHVVRFRHAEVMENGELGVRPLRHAKATDTIICNGETLTN
ncbi:hypothetical protein CLCR_10669 [Cladophialophora carrionii]|uniref:Bacterial alpha-L-rhamnosidase N-terminal domain-containing protein n=1 Tax=Cladophialophora carrionii TaxID=86049 RepID=A0A1C1CXD8_9EURO|nr:hypothetical protein CLCR_10669 [Cladophialophora carrionii]